MKCRATRDGLLGKTSYIHEGEVFEAPKCPAWAEPVNPPKKKADAEGAFADGEPGQKDGE